MSELANIITPQAEAFLETYLNTPSPTGFEWRGQQVWLDYIKPYIDEYHTDNYGTAYGVINPKAKYKVVIEAHADCSLARHETINSYLRLFLHLNNTAYFGY